MSNGNSTAADLAKALDLVSAQVKHADARRDKLLRDLRDLDEARSTLRRQYMELYMHWKEAAGHGGCPQ